VLGVKSKCVPRTETFDMNRTQTKIEGVCLGLALLGLLGSGSAAEPEHPTNSAVPVKIWRYAERWMTRADADGDGKLTAQEWPPSAGRPDAVDANQDGRVSVEELAQHIADFGRHRKIRLMPANFGGMVPLPSLLPPGVPGEERAATPGEEDRPQSPEDAPANIDDPAAGDSQKPEI